MEMSKKMPESIAQGNGSRMSEVCFQFPLAVKPVAETAFTAEVDFDSVKHLYSDKPLRFNRPKKLQ